MSLTVGAKPSSSGLLLFLSVELHLLLSILGQLSGHLRGVCQNGRLLTQLPKTVHHNCSENRYSELICMSPYPSTHTHTHTWSKCRQCTVLLKPGEHCSTQLIHTPRGHHAVVGLKQLLQYYAELHCCQGNQLISCIFILLVGVVTVSEDTIQNL